MTELKKCCDGRCQYKGMCHEAYCKVETELLQMAKGLTLFNELAAIETVVDMFGAKDQEKALDILEAINQAAAIVARIEGVKNG
jgi:uncharacterized protein (DUF4213/DUF364 family)